MIVDVNKARSAINQAHLQINTWIEKESENENMEPGNMPEYSFSDVWHLLREIQNCLVSAED